MKDMEQPTDKTPLISPGVISKDVHETEPDNSNKYIIPFVSVVALERFTYYSIVVNLFLFFNDNVYENYDGNDKQCKRYKPLGQKYALISVMVLIGMSWLLCVLGGWISDARLGKLKTITVGLVLYSIGTGLLFLSTWLLESYFKHEEVYRVVIVFSSILVALIGEGAYKANVAAFGAEQLNHKDLVSTRRYFNLYYFSLNIGSLLALSISAFIQQRYSFLYGFAIPFASITLALIIFVLSRKWYKTLPCQRMVGKVYQIVKEARRNSRRNEPSSAVTTPKLSWLDYARMKYGGSFLDWEVDEARYVFAIVPVFILLLPYMTIYNQMSATFIQQGIHMKLPSIGGIHNSFPAAWLNLFNAVTIVILLPIMEKIIYPWFSKRGYHIIPLTRISIGIVVSCFAIIAAGFVEMHVVNELDKNETTVNKNVNGHCVVAAKMSVFYQIPQYLLIGISEVFAAVGGLEFAYRNAPNSMQGMVMAMYFSIISFGSLIGSGLLELSELLGLIKKTEYSYNLTFYFFLLGGLMLLSWIIFIVYIERSRRRRSKHRRNRTFNKTGCAASTSGISSIAEIQS